jgi:serine/threonine protein kinase
MLKFLSEVFTHVGTAQVEDSDLSHGVNGSCGDAMLDAEDLMLQVHTRNVPVLHVNDDIKNKKFSEEFHLAVELSRGMFGFYPRLPTAAQTSGKADLSSPHSSGSLSGSLKIASSTKMRSAKVTALNLDGKSVVCKIYVSQDEDYDLYGVSKEIQVMKMIYSPYVINLYAHYESASGHRLIMDHFTGVLTTIIDGRGYSEAFAASVMKQVLLGVAHLHSLGIVHRNINTDNILQQMIVPNKIVHIKISGFGNAFVLPPREAMALFGRSQFFIKGGFSTKDHNSVKSVRSMKSAPPVTNAHISVSTSERPEYGQLATQPEDLNEDGANTPIPPPAALSASAAVILQAGSAKEQQVSRTTVADADHSHTTGTGDSSPVGGSPEDMMSRKEIIERLEKSPRRDELTPRANLTEDTETGSPHMIHRQTASSTKYRYATSVRYDTVPYKSYDQITGGLERGAVSGVNADYSFVAPEMFAGAYGPQADTWAVGVIAYYILAGHRPFSSTEGTDSDDLIMKIINGAYPIKGKIWRSLTEQSRKFVTGTVVWM